MEISAEWRPHRADGDRVAAATPLATFSGPARDLLTAERLLLNLIGRLSGIATLTSQYVRAIGDSSARVYDTRKTTPGWRRLEKFAVRCGGGCNHRTGLFDAVLIKDNHLAFVAASTQRRLTPAEAIDAARANLQQMFPDQSDDLIIEIEVDTLQQLEQVLPKRPDIVLLDNMSTDQLCSAVALRNAAADRGAAVPDSFCVRKPRHRADGVDVHHVADNREHAGGTGVSALHPVDAEGDRRCGGSSHRAGWNSRQPGIRVQQAAAIRATDLR